MATCAVVDEGGPPVGCKTTSALKLAIRVVAATDQHSRKRKRLPHDGLPAGQGAAQGLLLQVARSHQEGDFHSAGIFRMRRPGCDQQAPHAVRNQHDWRVAGKHGLFQLRHPVATQRPHPIVLFDPDIAVQRLPTALPMVGPAVVPAGQKQEAGCGHAL